METSPHNDTACPDQLEVGSFTTLRRLGLSDEELIILRRQGYLTQDDRGHEHGGYFRLRFRFGGRTRTVYLGRDTLVIDQVRDELKILQAARDRERRIAEVATEGKAMLRSAKRRLQPVLKQLGYHYHGDMVRKIRSDKGVDRRTIQLCEGD